MRIGFVLPVVGLLFCCGLLCSTNANAEVWKGTAPQTAVVGPNPTGEVRVGVKFNLGSDLLQPGTMIDFAIVDWTLSAASVGGELSMSVVRVEAPWESSITTALWGASGSVEGAYSWDIEPSEFLDGSGELRFDVTKIVREWIGGTFANNGLALITDDASATALMAQAGSAQLLVYYRKP